MCCWSSSWPCASSAAAVWEALWGSTPIITGMWAPFSRADRRHREGRPTLGRGRPLLSHSRSGAGGTAQPFLSQLKLSGSGVCGATCRRPGTLRLQPKGSYPHSISRGHVVERAPALSGPLPALGAVAVAALASPLDLGRAHLSEAPTSSASISATDRFSPSGVSQLRWRSRPMTITRSPLARESARCSAWPRHTFTLKNEVSPSRHSPFCWRRWVTATRRLVTGVPVLVKRSSGSSTRLPMMVVWLSAAIMAPSYWWGGWLAFGAEPCWTTSAPAQFEMGGAGGVGGSVVLAVQPHDGVGVVLAAGGDGDAGAEREGGFTVAEGLVAVGVVGVGGDAVVGVEPVEGLLQVAGGRPGVGGVLLQGRVGAAVVQAPAGTGLV